MNFRAASNPEYFDKNWNILQHAIREILKGYHNARHLSFGELHRHAYYMVLYNFGDKLYSELVATMTCHVKEIAKSVEATQGISFLEELSTKWNEYYKSLQLLRDILMYADRTYIANTKKKPVYELGLNLWRENVIYSNQIASRLLIMLLEYERRERAGEDVNRELIRNITNMLMNL